MRVMIKAGFYEADITPSVGMERPGNYFKDFIQDIAEELKVYATFLTDGTTRIALVSVDTCSIGPQIYPAVKAVLPDMLIVLSPTHLHNGGPSGNIEIADFYSPLAKRLLTEETIQGNPDYVKLIIRQIISAIRMAEKRTEEVELSFGKGSVEGVTFNRGFKMKNGHRATHPGKGNPQIVEPFEPIDTEVGAVGFWRKSDESFLGCLINFSCHGTCASIGGVNTDWPGQAIRTIRAVMGEKCGVTYLYGCAGDITQIDNQSLSPIEVGPRYSQKVGVSVGAEVLKILMRAPKGEISTFRSFEEKMQIFYRKPSPRRIAEAMEIIKLNQKGTAFNFAKEIIIVGEKTAHSDGTEITLQTIQLGPLAIVTMPGEVFCGVALAIKAASKFPFTWVSSLANGSIGYVPTAAALDPERGGSYETRLTSGTCTRPDTADRLVAKSTEILSRLTPGAVPTGPLIKPVDKIWDYGSNLPELE